MSRVAIYNLYWHTYGGGEQVSGAFAEFLAREHDVTLLGPTRPDIDASRTRLGVDLSSCEFVAVMDDDEAAEASSDFDVFVNGTYRSHARNRARRGIYYVHFPEPPATSRERVRSAVSQVGLAAMGPLVRGWEGDDTAHRVKRAFARRRRDLSWVESYSNFAANSEYTAGWVRRLWGAQSSVLYPAVRPVVTDVAESDKQPLIVSVGRFFDPKLGHCKKQAELLETFAQMHRSGRTLVDDREWRLAFVGGADAASREYTLGVRRAAQGLPVDVHVNKPREIVESNLRVGSIYWHGTGYGERLANHPERFEHFGIAVVEAMLAGCVPVVYGEAGPAEIVRHGVDGFHWHSPEQLAEFTYLLMTDPAKRQAMSHAATVRGREFSIDRFRSAIGAIVN
ncbi:MAG: glycosyltransferase [Actinobacteria bacterium]|nr:glycosyltransferase [Actinomycetota bacterium]